jgi:hypothetical protein
MTQTTIPAEFERYLQEKINIGGASDMNQMIFAYIPDLDLESGIDRGFGLPDVGLWVHQQDVDQAGKLGDDSIVYSVVVPSAVPEFTFNAIYLNDKNVANSCGMVVYKATETKENGMATTKSLVQHYSGAAIMAGITVDAATWQLDYQTRLFGIEDDHRLNCLDSYGHTAFIDGFTVTQQADPTKYAITPGLVYVGGLRGTLDTESIQTITTKPNGIYIDLHSEGTALSKWNNVLTITLSASALSDYVDATGNQHYVAKLATINADGSIRDLRVEQTGDLERADNAATNVEIDAGSIDSKHVNLEQFWRGIDKKIAVLTLQIEKERVSIGEIIEITGNAANPAILKGYGTWSSFGAGLVTVGVGSHTDSRDENKTWIDGQTEGEYKHAQTEAEMATHDHTDTFAATTGNDTHGHTIAGIIHSGAPVSGGYDPTSGSPSGGIGSKMTSEDTHNHTVTITGAVQNAGSGNAANNTQPTIAVYRWKRTA